MIHLIEQLHSAFIHYVATTYALDFSYVEQASFDINTDENKQQFGDITSNVAMILAKQLHKKPRDLALDIARHFSHDAIEKIEVAGPGFLNFFLTQSAFNTLAQTLFIQENRFFKASINPHVVNIEFVSANPTGPLHFGHGRGGIIGDVLANILSFLGHKVTKEFYINDAGIQIAKLGSSLKTRYQQAAGLPADVPTDGYHGEYLVDLANRLFQEHGSGLLDQPDSFFGSYAQKNLLEKIKQTLIDYGIAFDVWFSEKTLHESRAIDKALALLQKEGHLFEEDGALWFRSTAFGDDKDRVLKKKNGEFTYAAPDIAYMKDKIDRGHEELIYVLGHDHHSYATRLNGMLHALGLNNHPLSVILYQLVSIKDGDIPLRMSKRAGRMVTLQDIIDTVGKDVTRFFYLNRKADAQLEFDLNLALKRTDENPVYYIQYAYVRCGSILENAVKHEQLLHIAKNDLDRLTTEDNQLIKKIIACKSLLQIIAKTHETHLLAYYSFELAQAFNRYYNKNRVIDLENIPLSRARLALVLIVRRTLGLCLDLLGLSKPERM